MSLARFLEVMFTRGEVVFRNRPVVAPPRDAEALKVLEREYARYVLDLPGKPVNFNAEVALQAAEVLRFASWFLLSHEDDDEEVTRRVSWQGLATTPGQHYSADLTLRFAERIHRRARALNPTDTLVTALEDTLRRRPLSGVLCDIAEPPVGLEFAGHEPLMLLYAERYALHPKPDWLPEGKAREYVELVGETASIVNR